MITHLQQAHPNEYSKTSFVKKRVLPNVVVVDGDTDDSEVEVEAIGVGGTVPKRSKSKTYGPLDAAFRRQQPIDKKSEKWKKITKNIVNLITGAMLPIAIVEHADFCALIKELEPNYNIPSRRYFSETAIPAEYNRTVSTVKNDLKNNSSFYAITTDGWTSSVNLNPYISVTVHYIDIHSFSLISRNLGTVFAPQDHTGANIAELLTDELKEWNLEPENLVSATTDNGANMKVACRSAGYFRLPCFGHVLHNGVNSGIDDNRVTRAKGVAKQMTAAFSNSSKKRRKLEQIQVGSIFI